MQRESVRVVIQERQRLIREGLSIFLDRRPSIEVVGTSVTASELVSLCEREAPDVVVLEADVTEWCANRLTETLRRSHVSVRVVGIYQDIDRATAVRARQAGMSGLADRRAGVDGVLGVIEGRPSSWESRPSEGRRDRQALTPRERAALTLVASGWSTREISDQMGISPKTVENHKQRIFAKLDVQNQAHAVAVAMRGGMLRVEDLIGTRALGA
jgi:DNA-binding NarL/FixJ family response regulator